MFAILRAATYASTFIGLFLIFVPARLISWPGLPRIFLLVGALWAAGLSAPGQVAAQEHPYVPPADPLVRETLEEWQDLKFGLLMHWGLYAQLGIVESWALCSEDQSFQDRDGMPDTVLIPDGDDAGRFYSMPTFLYGGVYWGMLAQFSEAPQKIEVELVWSRDGFRWERAPGRPMFIPVGEQGVWDDGMIFAADRVIERDDEWWLYYSGHDGYHDEKGRAASIEACIISVLCSIASPRLSRSRPSTACRACSNRTTYAATSRCTRPGRTARTQWSRCWTAAWSGATSTSRSPTTARRWR